MKNPKEAKNLLENINYDVPTQDICKARTEYCLNWYSKKAIFYKHFFFTLSIVNIAAPLISTYIVTLESSSLLAAILTVFATFSASLLALFNVKDKWITYRSAAEFIKSQYTLYCANAAPYTDSKTSHAIYLKNIEQYMATVHIHWCETQQASKDSLPDSSNTNS